MGISKGTTAAILLISGLSVLCGSAWGELTDGLVSHWKLDEGDGSTAYDSAGDNDGIIYGAVWTVGQFDAALSFDGYNDYVNIGDKANLEGFPQVTIAAWIYWIGSGQNFIAGKEFVYKIDISSGKIRFLTGNNWAGAILTSSQSINLNTWYHIVATYNGSQKLVYINGEVDQSSVLTSGSLGMNTNPATLGVEPFTVWHDWYKGKIDDVRIYDRALSAEEVQQLYEGKTTVAIDIKPGSCPNPFNPESNGVLPVAILGTEDFDVNSIDTVSIRLAGVAPVRSSFEDVATPVSDGNECECNTVGPDGYTDLTLKFKTQQIAEQLVNTYGEPTEDEVLVLPLTGILTDGTPIEGTDCIRIVGNVPKSVAARRADINEDGVVDVLDFATIANYWLEPTAAEY